MSLTVCYVYLALQIIFIILSPVSISWKFTTQQLLQFQLYMCILYWLVSCGWMWQRECPHTHTPTHPWACMVQYDVREEHSQPDLPTVVMQWWTPASSELSVFCRCRGVRITCPSPLTQLQEWCCLQTDIHSSFPKWGLMMLVTISVHLPTELVAMIATFI